MCAPSKELRLSQSDDSTAASGSSGRLGSRVASASRRRRVVPPPLSTAGWGSLVAVGERPKSAGARDGPGVDEWRLEPTFVGELVPRVIAAAQFKARRRPPPAAPAVPRENAAASRPPCVVETPPVGSPAEVLVIGDLGAMLLASPDAARLVSLSGRAGPSSSHR
jgi:hypothetical protein